MTNRMAQAHRFRELHVRGNPLVLFNAWDPGSAKAVADAGAGAIATGSWSVAAAYGFEDGEKIPWPLALANLERIISSIDLPVTVDLESGYGDCARIAREAVSAGAIGFNFEDGKLGQEGLYSLDEQSARIRSARAAADDTLSGVFINARTDIFLRADPSTHSDRMVDEAVQRAKAYADSGADGFFVPGLVEPKKIARICEATPLPVNVMARPGAFTRSELAKLGVARISYGPHPYLLAMTALKQAAKEAMG